MIALKMVMRESIKNLGMTVLKSPPHSPKANAICERVVGTIRCECPGLVDSVIGIALAIDAENVGGSLQRGKPAHGVGPGCSRSAYKRGSAPQRAISASLGRANNGTRSPGAAGLHHEYSLATLATALA